MNNTIDTSGNLFRLMGLMGICIGAAWAIQVLGFGGTSAMGRLLWIIGAASIAGAGAGLIAASASLRWASARA